MQSANPSTRCLAAHNAASRASGREVHDSQAGVARSMWGTRRNNDPKTSPQLSPIKLSLALNPKPPHQTTTLRLDFGLQPPDLGGLEGYRVVGSLMKGRLLGGSLLWASPKPKTLNPPLR